MKTVREIQTQYLKEHPERKDESDKEFALSNYIEWLEDRVINSLQYNTPNRKGKRRLMRG